MNKMIIFVMLLFLAGCATTEVPQLEILDDNMSKATFAGGCFWCMEAAYEGMEGVKDVISGYSGGHKENPTYMQVVSGKTGHLEAVQMIYDPSIVTYEQLLDTFWRQINPTDDGGQFSDRGSQYRTAIFHHDEEQKRLADKSKKDMDESGKFDKPIVTEVRALTNFYVAEEYHQDYAQKRTRRYQLYVKASGRKGYIKDTWGEK